MAEGEGEVVLAGADVLAGLRTRIRIFFEYPGVLGEVVLAVTDGKLDFGPREQIF